MGMQLIPNFFNFTSRVFDGLLRLQVGSRGANQEEVLMSGCQFTISELQQFFFQSYHAMEVGVF